MKEESSDERNAALAGEELAGLLDHAPAGWSAEALTHNAHIAVTAGIWRVRAGPASFVLKVLSPGGTAASGEWSPSGDPTHWNYWEREALAYESGVTSTYWGRVFRVPASWPLTAVRAEMWPSGWKTPAAEATPCRGPGGARMITAVSPARSALPRGARRSRGPAWTIRA